MTADRGQRYTAVKRRCNVDGVQAGSVVLQVRVAWGFPRRL